MHTLTHTQALTQRHTHMYRGTHRYTHIQRHTLTKRHTHTHRLSYTHTRNHTCIYTHRKMYPSTDRIAKTDTSAQAYRQPHTRKQRGKHAHIAHINTNERQSTHTHTHTPKRLPPGRPAQHSRQWNANRAISMFQELPRSASNSEESRNELYRNTSLLKTLKTLTDFEGNQLKSSQGWQWTSPATQRPSQQ